MKTIKIGGLRVRNQLFLAPMVDVTDLAFRLLCRKEGVGMAYTEMLYIDAILHENLKTKKLMTTCEKDKPLGIQITGNNENEFRKIIPYIYNYDLVDLNCGCPSMKIIGSSAGSYLLRKPEKIKRIIKIFKDQGLNVSAKIRLGFKENNVLKVAKTIERAGADALAVHARLAVDGNNVSADWKWISKVKKEVGIPVIGNGDINSGKRAKEMLEIADGAMIGRAAIGDPSIFSRITHYLRTGKEKEIDYKKNLKYFREYLKLTKKYDLIDIGRIKYLGGNFIKGFEGASKLRSQLMSLKNFDEIEEFVNNI